jgi:hypothetical protein
MNISTNTSSSRPIDTGEYAQTHQQFPTEDGAALGRVAAIGHPQERPAPGQHEQHRYQRRHVRGELGERHLR